MPPPKKAAKKIAAKHAHHDDAGKDMRRAYEHLGRVEILHSLLEKAVKKDVADLTMLAEQELALGHMKDAADLLRAAEHLSFGALNSSEAEKNVDAKLVDAITREFGHKLDKAEEHWSDEHDHHAKLEAIYSTTAQCAQKAFDSGAYRQALELARGAEALAHVKVHEAKQLGAEQHKLNA